MQAASALRSPAFAVATAGTGKTSAAAAAAVASASASASSAASSPPLSALSVLRSILAKEGWRGLWRGADFALLMSLPMVGVYMPLYDDALAALRALPGKEGGEGEGDGEAGKRSSIARLLASDAVAPALAGGAARAVAVLATSPLELARTRAQAPPEWGAAASAARSASPSPSPSLPSKNLGARVRRLPAALPQPSAPGVPAAVRAAWTGSAATLARDVPFSALYWALLEPVRSSTLRWWSRFGSGDDGTCPRLPSSSSSSSLSQPQPSASAVVVANLVSGATAGGAAAALTTPFDVVKTKLQLEAGGSGGNGGGGAPPPRSAAAAAGTAEKPPSVLSTLRSVRAQGGARALFAGVGPRSARAAPACAIVVAAYELLKMVGGGGGGEWRDEEVLGLAAEEN